MVRKWLLNGEGIENRWYLLLVSLLGSLMGSLTELKWVLIDSTSAEVIINSFGLV